MNKKTWIALGALVLVAAILLGIYYMTRPTPEEGSKTVTVEIVHADGSQNTYTYHTDLEYLSELLLEQALVTGYEGEYGFVVETVEGESADWTTDGAYWALYEGEDYATTAASGIVLVDGGVYKLIYEKF